MRIVCGVDEPQPEFPDLGLDKPCCYGVAMGAAEDCSCWRPVYDTPGHADPVEGMTPTVRPGGMCGDCAYRPDSPERQDDPQHRGNATELEMLAEDGRPFYCHQGMRRILRWEHPSGAVLPAHPADYAPPIVDDVPIKVDGTPAYLCGGWDARRRALAAQLSKEESEIR
ncbi:hypothetical protein [Amycolatopsis eburnea]|uniref:Uncharacterized protein n=1 Tax=Amycolatopsis eburnea TaxID=2267691 RepID=A0A427TPR4_9PSEU|nr:hypothetical protein [Amycolatopsis eburnea]RSD26371.1 hypothetical protein EIY87_00470 [Amycolatopsis eburnea]